MIGNKWIRKADYQLAFKSPSLSDYEVFPIPVTRLSFGSICAAIWFPHKATSIVFATPSIWNCHISCEFLTNRKALLCLFPNKECWNYRILRYCSNSLELLVIAFSSELLGLLELFLVWSLCFIASGRFIPHLGHSVQFNYHWSVINSDASGALIMLTCTATSH